MKVVIVVASASGHTRRMADAAAEGASEAGAQVSVFAPDEASEEDLLAADALILGSGVHMGGMESSMSAFFERMAPLWLEHELADVILENVAGNPSSWAELMKVRALIDLGQNEEAQKALNELGDIAVGLEGVRDELGVKVSATLLDKFGDEPPSDLQLNGHYVGFGTTPK